MKRNLKTLLFVFSVMLMGLLTAQTAGTLSVSFTQIAHSPCYSGTKNVLAAWVQTSGGGFVKTKLRYVGSNTKDHLPTFSVNAGGTAANCLAAAVNVVSATTGATLTSFGTRTFTWDGTDINGNVVPDGTYQISIQETWNHGSGSTALSSFTFTKGPAQDHQTPAATGSFSNVTLDWVPGVIGIEEVSTIDENANVYPNPSIDGGFNVTYTNANKIKVVNVLGQELYNLEITDNSTSKFIDLSLADNGIYFVYIFDGAKTTRKKVVVSKN